MQNGIQIIKVRKEELVKITECSDRLKINDPKVQKLTRR